MNFIGATLSTTKPTQIDLTTKQSPHPTPTPRNVIPAKLTGKFYICPLYTHF